MMGHVRLFKPCVKVRYAHDDDYFDRSIASGGLSVRLTSHVLFYRIDDYISMPNKVIT